MLAGSSARSSPIVPGSSSWPAGAGSPSSTARCWPTPTRRSRPTPSWGGGRTRSCSRASSAARSGPPTASSACGRARWSAPAASDVEVLRRDATAASCRVDRAGARRRDPLRVPGRLPGRAVAGRARRAAALLRRRGRLARLRHRARVRAAARHASPTSWALPELCFVITDTVVIFDNLRRTLKVVAAADVGDGRRRRARLRRRLRAHRRACSSAWRSPAPPLRPLDPTPPAPAAARRASTVTQRELRGGRAAHPGVHPGRRRLPGRATRSASRSPRGGVDPFDVYRALRVINPSPYMFHLEFPEAHGHRRLARGAGARSRAARSRCGRSPARARAARPPRRTRALEAELRADPEGARRARDADRPRPQRRRARRARRHRAASTSRWWSSATRTSCTWSRTCAGELAPGMRAARRAARGVPGRHAVAARRRSAPWRSSRSSSRRGAGSTAARSATSRTPATSTWRSPSARWSPRATRSTCRRAPASSPTACPAAEYQESVNKARAVLRAVEIARARPRGGEP